MIPPFPPQYCCDWNCCIADSKQCKNMILIQNKECRDPDILFRTF